MSGEPSSDTTCLLLLPDKQLSRLRGLTSAPSATVGGVRFVTHEPATDADATADIVLHKHQYDVAVAAGAPCDAATAAAARCEALRRVASRAALFDPLPAVARFADRSALCGALAELAPAVEQPRFAVLADDSDASISAALKQLRFPVLCKPLVACGTAESHALAVALREDGLRELCTSGGGGGPLRPPMLLQEHVNHGGVVLKAYLVGEATHLASKPSLPDLDPEWIGETDKPALVCFDSQKPCPGPAHFGPSAVPFAMRRRDPAHFGPSPNRDEVDAILRAVARKLGVQLLGVDLVEADDGRLLVVDANYFPMSPDSFPGLADALAAAVRRAAARDGRSARAEPTLPPGAQVLLRGLSSHPELNGAQAGVGAWHVAKGRFSVRLSSGAYILLPEIKYRN